MPAVAEKRPTVFLASIPTGAEFARRTGLHPATVNRIFSPNPDENRWPSEETAHKIAERMGITVGMVYDMVLLKRKVSARQR